VKRERVAPGVYRGGFWEETWGFEVDLVWPVTEKVRNKYAKERYGLDLSKDSFDDCSGTCYDLRGLDDHKHVVLILLAEWDLSPSSISTLSHEAFHATDEVLRDRGIKLTSDSAEAYAYLHGSIMRRCLEILGPGKKVR